MFLAPTGQNSRCYFFKTSDFLNQIWGHSSNFHTSLHCQYQTYKNFITWHLWLQAFKLHLGPCHSGEQTQEDPRHWPWGPQSRPQTAKFLVKEGVRIKEFWLDGFFVLVFSYLVESRKVLFHFFSVFPSFFLHNILLSSSTRQTAS